MASVEQGPILVDSNVFIDILRADLDPQRELGEHCGDADIVTCGMIKLEVLRGIRSEKLLARLEAFFEVMRFVPTDNAIWGNAIVLARKLSIAGYTLPAQDVLIATSAFRAGASVLTADKHFAHIPNLPVIPSPW
ncbi:MAG: PIN domain-containing protein [Verrucomicrobiales bacterium]